MKTIETRQFTRFGVKWSMDGKRWLGVVNDDSLSEAEQDFSNTTAPFKKLVRHEITETVILDQGGRTESPGI